MVSIFYIFLFFAMQKTQAGLSEMFYPMVAHMGRPR